MFGKNLLIPAMKSGERFKAKTESYSISNTNALQTTFPLQEVALNENKKVNTSIGVRPSSGKSAKSCYAKHNLSQALQKKEVVKTISVNVEKQFVSQNSSIGYN